MNKLKILALIPARMGSSRFPGKPMAELNGQPMVGHVLKRVRANSSLAHVAVATCDHEIAEYIRSIGGDAIMTSDHHQRASDRCAEALNVLEGKSGEKFDVVVMIQGDEPMVHPEMISEAVAPMIIDDSVKVVNLGGEIGSEAEFHDPNCIKVVCDKKSDAIYFSRQPIPTSNFPDATPKLKQVCIIPFRKDFLLEYTRMTPTPLEIAESIDMLRIVENGLKVRIARTEYSSHAVDTPEDLQKVTLLMQQMDEHFE